MNQNCTRLILIAEDDIDDQELITIAFSNVDPELQLRIVNDGKEALTYLHDAAEGDLPCVIILDYNMPELNGAQVLQQLLANRRFAAIPKVVLSTSSNPKYIQDCLRSGASDYKVKPHDFGALVNVAREMAALCDKAA